MNDVLTDAIRSAERAIRGVDAERAVVEGKMAGLQADLELLSRPSVGEDLAYLVSLADGLGLHDAADDLLERVSLYLRGDAMSLSGMDASQRNRLAVAVAERGHLVSASRLLSPSESDDVVSVPALANQAAVKLRVGDLVAAADYADRARRTTGDADAPGDLNAQFLATAVLAEIRREGGQHQEADRLLDELSDIARRLIPLLGRDHPTSLSTVVTVASAECEAAAAAHDVERMTRAADVIAIAVQRISAALGSEHPRAVSALRCLAAAEYSLAQATDDERCLKNAISLAATAVERSRRGHQPTQSSATALRSPAPFSDNPEGSRIATSRRPTPGGLSHAGATGNPVISPVPFYGPGATAIGDPVESQGELVRPYAMTGGRTRPREVIAIEALVSTTSTPAAYAAMLPEHRRILELCEELKSVAEISALLGMPLGVARILVADLAEAGLVVIHRPSHGEQAPDMSLLQRVLDGLRRL